MAFVVSTKRGTFEIRESRSTPEGPRSRTLVTFRELTDAVIEKADARAAKPLDADRLRGAALRAGAPLGQSPADRAARELIAELGKGREPEAKLRRLLTTMLTDGHRAAAPADPSSAVAEWMTATAEERGRNLVDLLLLADALPPRGKGGQPPLRFPRMDASPA